MTELNQLEDVEFIEGVGIVPSREREWDKMFCAECREYKPEDERVQSGLKCGSCAGYGKYIS